MPGTPLSQSVTTQCVQSPYQQRDPHEVVNRWRVDVDWWRVPISRMYYLVTTATMLMEIYEDLCTGNWYIERVID